MKVGNKVFGGEYKKIIDERAILESLISFKRAGANAIVSYFGDRIENILNKLS